MQRLQVIANGRLPVALFSEAVHFCPHFPYRSFRNSHTFETRSPGEVFACVGGPPRGDRRFRPQADDGDARGEIETHGPPRSMVLAPIWGLGLAWGLG